MREINNERHAREKKKKIIQVTTRDLQNDHGHGHGHA